MRNEWNLRGLATASILAIAVCIGFSAPASALSYSDASLDVDVEQIVATAYITQDFYRVIEVSLQATNNGASTLTDVKFVVPFAWAQKNSAGSGVEFAYSWIDANGQWESNAVTGKDLAGGVFAKPVDDSDFPAITLSAALGTMLMSDTDLALSDNWGTPTAYISSTDNVPAWDIAATMAPGDIVDFKIYLQYERDSQIYTFWVNGSPVAVPEPGTALLLTLGLAGLAAAGRRRSLH